MARKPRVAGESVELDGARLRRCRVGMGQSQKQVAERAGLTTAYISIIERSERHSVSKEAATALAQALDGMPLKELMVAVPGVISLAHERGMSRAVNVLPDVVNELRHKIDEAVRTAQQTTEEMITLTCGGDDTDADVERAIDHLLRPYEPSERMLLRTMARVGSRLEALQGRRLVGVELAHLVDQFVPDVDVDTLCAALLFGAVEAMQEVSIQQAVRAEKARARRAKHEGPYLLALEGWTIGQIAARASVLCAPPDPRDIYEDDELCGDILSYDPRGIALVLVNMLRRIRHLDDADIPEQRDVAYQVLRLYGPLAGQLGWRQLRRELSEWGFKYYDPDLYQSWSDQVALQRERTRPIAELASQRVRDALCDQGITNPDIRLSEQSLYSTLRDAGRGDTPFHLLLVTDQPTAVVRAVLHLRTLFPSPDPVTDYVSHPKPNGYRSYHTTIIVEGLRIRVRIRTRDMDMAAERGILWQLKLRPHSYAVSLQHLRMDYLPRLSNHTSGIDGSGQADPDRRMYVRTRDGLVRGLPGQPTVLQFAYAINPRLGDQAIAALVDGRPRALHYALRGMEEVEILSDSDSYLGTRDTMLKWSAYRTLLRSTSGQARIVAANRPGLLLDLCNIIVSHDLYIEEARVDTGLPSQLAKVTLDLRTLPDVTELLCNDLAKVVGVWQVRVGPPAVPPPQSQRVWPERQVRLVLTDGATDDPTVLDDLWQRANAANLNIPAARIVRPADVSMPGSVTLSLVPREKANDKALDAFCATVEKLPAVAQVCSVPCIVIHGRDRSGLLHDLCDHLFAYRADITTLRAEVPRTPASEEREAIVRINLVEMPERGAELRDALTGVKGVDAVTIDSLLPSLGDFTTVGSTASRGDMPRRPPQRDAV